MAPQCAGGMVQAAGSHAGPLSGSPSQWRPRAAAGDPLRPPRYLPLQALAVRRGPATPPVSPLPQPGRLCRRPPCSCRASSGEPEPSEERQEQNRKFRLIKHLLILQKLSRPLRNPPETCAAPVIFCYIIFLVKYFPRQSPQRGSNITVTNRNQCALTY